MKTIILLLIVVAVIAGLVFWYGTSHQLSFSKLESATYISNGGLSTWKLDIPISFQIGKNIAYGDLNGDGQEDAAFILEEATDTPYLIAVINHNGDAVPVDTYELGDNISVNSIQIAPGKVILNIIPAGTSQNQTVEFTLATRAVFNQPELAVSFSSSTESQTQNSSTWMTYSSPTNGFSFKYPADYLLTENVYNLVNLSGDGDDLNRSDADPTGIHFDVWPITTNFQAGIRESLSGICAGGGSAGLVCINYADGFPAPLTQSPMTVNSFTGYKVSFALQQNSGLPNEAVLYFFRLSSSTMLRIYGYRNDQVSPDLSAIMETLSR